MYEDMVLAVFDVQNKTVGVELCVITGALRTTALAMTSPCMRRIVDTYALYCARSAMLFKRALQQHSQKSLDAYRQFQKQRMGLAWPLLQQSHPALSLSADDVYLSTAVEFLPAACTTWIYARLAELRPAGRS